MLLIALSHVLGNFVRRWRPKWTVPFVSEQHDTQELPLDQPKESLRWTVALLIFSATGLLAETVQFVPPRVDPSAFSLVLSWVSYPPVGNDRLLMSSIGYSIDSGRSQAAEIMFYCIAGLLCFNFCN